MTDALLAATTAATPEPRHEYRVIGEARLTRATRDVAFAEGRAYVGGRDVVRCSGVFKLMGAR